MRKHGMVRAFTTLVVLSLFVGAANAATWTTSGNGDLLADIEPDGVLDFWTPSTAAPTAGNTDTWVIQNSMTGVGTWYGGTTQMDSGRLWAQSGDLTVQDLVLNGGYLMQDNSNRTLSGDTLTLNGGSIRKERKGNFTLSFDDYVGSGTVALYGNNPSDATRLTLTSTQADAFDGFTGTFQSDGLNGETRFRFGLDITNATFSILLTDEFQYDTTTPNYTGMFDLYNDVSVTSFQIIDHQMVDDGQGGTVLAEVLNHVFAPGTYTLDTATNPGAIDLTNVGGQDFSPFFIDSTGTFTVVAGGPGPGLGDANGDGFVDDSDLSLLLSNWQQTTDWAHGEFSGDPPVNDDDLSLLLANWTGAAPSALAVPEPASLAMLGLGGLFLLRRRAR